MLYFRKILEYMKSQNLMLNETIFNALVKGHIKKGYVSASVSNSFETSLFHLFNHFYKVFSSV